MGFNRNLRDCRPWVEGLLRKPISRLFVSICFGFSRTPGHFQPLELEPVSPQSPPINAAWTATTKYKSGNMHTCAVMLERESSWSTPNESRVSSCVLCCSLHSPLFSTFVCASLMWPLSGCPHLQTRLKGRRDGHVREWEWLRAGRHMRLHGKNGSKLSFTRTHTYYSYSTEYWYFLTGRMQSRADAAPLTKRRNHEEAVLVAACSAHSSSEVVNSSNSSLRTLAVA